MVKEPCLIASSTRHRAAGMVNGGLTQVQVTEQLKTGPRTLKRWMALDCREETLENHGDRGRKTAPGRAAKIGMAKSAMKRHQLTRKLV